VAKDSSRTDGELQRLVESWGSESLLKKSNNPCIPTCCLRGFKEKCSSKNKLQHVQWSDMTGSSNGTGFCGQMKLRKELFGSKHTRWV